jgi:membrane protein
LSTAVSSGTAPESPTRLSLSDWIAVFKRAFKQFVADDCMGLAQQIAYSSLLAFFPAVIFLVGLFGLLGIYDDLQEFLGAIAPAAVQDALEIAEDSATESGTAALAVALGAFGAVWAASGAMGSMIKAVNRAYDRVETRPFWKVRLIAIVLVLLSGLVLAGLFLLIVFGGPLGEAIADQANLGGAFDLLWDVLRWPLTFVAILLFFAIVYYLAPDVEHRSWKWITPGSLVGAVLWLVLSGLFALYTSFAGSYDKTYGSVAGAIVLLLWLNYSAFAILFGAELNSELDRQADIRASGGERAGLTSRSRRLAPPDRSVQTERGQSPRS